MIAFCNVHTKGKMENLKKSNYEEYKRKIHKRKALSSYEVVLYLARIKIIEPAFHKIHLFFLCNFEKWSLHI